MLEFGVVVLRDTRTMRGQSAFRSDSSFYVVLVTTFVTFCAFYAPQPLLPLLSLEFDVSATSIALLITVTFLILCVAPFIYGLLLPRYSAHRWLILSSALLGLLQFAFAYADTYTILLTVRIAQGLIFPAVFTAAVTYCSQAGAESGIAYRVSLYIATTIVGGLGGRLFAGFISNYFHWSLTFELLGTALLLCSVSLLFVAPETVVNRTRSSVRSAAGLLQQRDFQLCLALLFTTFLSFSAVLNALPFRLVSLDPAISTARISLVYSGYLVGMVIAANASGIAVRLGGEVRALCIALVFFLAGLLLLAVPDTVWLIFVGFITSGSMFLIHSTLSGRLNSLQPRNSGMVNGLYISVYYIAGAIGSLIPLWIYNHAGWSVFLLALIFTSSLGLLSLYQMSGSERK